jgi:hypothetical protein
VDTSGAGIQRTDRAGIEALVQPYRWQKRAASPFGMTARCNAPGSAQNLYVRFMKYLRPRMS